MKLPNFGLHRIGHLRSQFLIQDGEKKRLNLTLIGLTIVPLVVVGSIGSLFVSKDDTSYISQCSDRPTQPDVFTPDVRAIKKTVSHNILQEESKQPMEKRTGPGKPIKYSAKQIIDRSMSGGSSFMAAGTNLIGKLLTAIDTRDDEQIIKVLLPYGGTYGGERVIERGSILFGRARYGGHGDKVFVRFSRFVNPEGTEFEIQAQALASKDLSPGLAGNYHSNFDSRMAAAVGLSMIAAGSDVLVEKESVGVGAAPTAKSTMRNAALAGVSRAAQSEAENRANDMEDKENYVTVESGMELIVSLTESFKGESSYGTKK